MCHCSQPFKTWKTMQAHGHHKAINNITPVHYSQIGRISILMRVCNHDVLLLSYQESVSTVDKVMKLNLLTLSQPIHKLHPMPGVSSQTPHRLVTLSVIKSFIEAPYISRSATLSSDGTCSTEICIQIPSANAAEDRLNRIWKSYMSLSFSTKFKVTY